MMEQGDRGKGSITAVVLAGGRGNRMGGQDKGLLAFHGRPLIEHILDGLRPQVGNVLISANRNGEAYRSYGRVIGDTLVGFQGPLAGFAAALRVASTPYVLSVPCDAPNVPPQLAERLLAALQASDGAELAVAHDGFRLQPVYALLSQCLLDDLQHYLVEGGRSVRGWYARHRMVTVDFSDCAASFRNMNTPADRQMLEGQVPLLGFCAYSGTGKTTLLTQLIPLLREQGLRIAVIKHTHHVIDLDKPGKDSYRMREAGAQQVVLASHQRIISMQENSGRQREASLADALACISPLTTDLVLVEGFKHEAYPKIELHRPSLGKPLMYPADGNVIAVATDEPGLELPAHLARLDLNAPETVVAFVRKRVVQVSRPD